MPKLTILIPTYNCARFLKECIDSICVQNFNDYELLIIDDGSTDHTDVVVKGIEDERIVYIKNDRNLGVVATLNKGLEIAKGEFIARMDADDVIVGNRLETQIDFLENNPQYGMVGSWYKIMNENGNVISEVKSNVDESFLSLALKFANHFAHPAVMMRTDIAKRLRYDKKFKHCEDHELWLRFSEVSKITNLPFFFLNVRLHSKSTCRLNQKELKISVIELLSRELDKLRIDHDIEELMLHSAVCFGLAPKLIKDKTKELALLAWYEKIFSSSILNKRYSKEWLLNFKNYMLFAYSGVNPKTLEG